MRPVTVVKCGGNEAVDQHEVCADIAARAARGDRVVLVHGGSADIDGLARRLGLPSRRLTSPDGLSARYTDQAMLEVVIMALTGLAKPRLVTELARAGATAIGLSGLDASLLRARRKKAHRAVAGGRTTVVRDDHSGRIEQVNAVLLGHLLDLGVIPVVSPPAIAEDGRPVNVDADRAAAALAAGLGACALVLLTAAPGVLADPDDETSLLTSCALPDHGPPPYRDGGMGLKLVAAREALLGGVGSVVISDGRRPWPVEAALSGAGTQVTLADQNAGTLA